MKKKFISYILVLTLFVPSSLSVFAQNNSLRDADADLSFASQKCNKTELGIVGLHDNNSKIKSGDEDIKSNSQSADSNNKVIEGVTALNLGNLDEAYKKFKQAIQYDSKNGAAYYYLGKSELYKGNSDNALIFLTKATELEPKNFWYRQKLAETYGLKGDDNVTIKVYEDLLKDFPKRSDLYYILVGLYLNQKRYNDVLSVVDKIETLYGKNERTVLTRYEILLQLDKPDEAIEVLKQYSEEDPSPRILSILGDYSIRQYKDSLALAYYDEALNLYDNYVPALLGKAEVYRMKQNNPKYFELLTRFMSDNNTPSEIKVNYIQAIITNMPPSFLVSNKVYLNNLMDISLEKHPTDSSILSLAEQYYGYTGDIEKATEIIKKDLNLYPNRFTTMVMYVTFLLNDRNWDELIVQCNNGIECYPNEVAFYQMKNYAYYYQQKYEEILNNSEAILKQFPDNSGKSGRSKKSKNSNASDNSSNPNASGNSNSTNSSNNANNPNASGNLDNSGNSDNLNVVDNKEIRVYALSMIGDTYHTLGNNKKAYKAYKSVLKIDPECLVVLNNYAYYLSIENRKLKKALEMSEITIKKEPDNPTYLDTYAWILHLLGRDEEAKPYYKHAMLYGGKESAVVLDHYAEVLYSLKEYILAKVYWDMAIEQNDPRLKDLQSKVDEKMSKVKN